MYCDIENLGTADNYLDEIRGMPHVIQLFGSFTLNELETLCRYLQCYGAPGNYPLISEGQEIDYLLLILTGSVEIRRGIPGDGIAQFAEVTAGETVGEMSLIDGQPGSEICITAVPTDFAVLTQEGLNRLLMQSPRLANKLLLVLLRKMTRRLRDVNRFYLPVSLH